MDIEKIVYKTRHFLALKKTIKPTDISDSGMYDSAFKKLSAYLIDNNIKPTGPASTIYFKWDIPNQIAELGISFPVDGVKEVNDPELSLIDIPESKAIKTTLYGDYSGLASIHQSLRKYLEDNKLTYSNIAIEEMVTMPAPNKPPITNVFYFYK